MCIISNSSFFFLFLKYVHFLLFIEIAMLKSIEHSTTQRQRDAATEVNSINYLYSVCIEPWQLRAAPPDYKVYYLYYVIYYYW